MLLVGWYVPYYCLDMETYPRKGIKGEGQEVPRGRLFLRQRNTVVVEQSEGREID